MNKVKHCKIIICKNFIQKLSYNNFIFYSRNIKIAPIRIIITAIVFLNKFESLNIFPPIIVAHKTDVLLIARVNATEAKLTDHACVNL